MLFLYIYAFPSNSSIVPHPGIESFKEGCAPTGLGFQYGWADRKASLPIDSSRAAATAYKIASHPASEPSSAHAAEDGASYQPGISDGQSPNTATSRTSGELPILGRFKNILVPTERQDVMNLILFLQHRRARKLARVVQVLHFSFQEASWKRRINTLIHPLVSKLWEKQQHDYIWRCFAAKASTKPGLCCCSPGRRNQRGFGPAENWLVGF